MVAPARFPSGGFRLQSTGNRRLVVAPTRPCPAPRRRVPMQRMTTSCAAVGLLAAIVYGSQGEGAPGPANAAQSARAGRAVPLAGARAPTQQGNARTGFAVPQTPPPE